VGSGAVMEFLAGVQELANEKFAAGKPKPVLDLASMRGLTLAARLELGASS